MRWTTRQFTKAQMDRAGRLLVADKVSDEDLNWALQVINNWRSSHSFPLNTFQMTLRRHAKLVEPRSLVAQRIKRLSSIESKLRIYKTMNLTQMQDIGGCRAVVSSVSKVKALREVYKRSKMRHVFVDEDDYIATPKPSGYRGFHLIYRYRSDRSPEYNGLQIEMQLRSSLQHAWATAVETVGTFLKQALKSSQGPGPWLNFFSLMGSEMAFKEKTPLVPGTPIDRSVLREQIAEASSNLEVEEKLKSYGAALSTTEEEEGKNSRYFLLELVPRDKRLVIRGYNASDLNRATIDYLQAERDIKSSPGAEAVLVSVDSLHALRRAYPNYFLDTVVFLQVLREALAGLPAKTRLIE